MASLVLSPLYFEPHFNHFLKLELSLLDEGLARIRTQVEISLPLGRVVTEKTHLLFL